MLVTRLVPCPRCLAAHNEHEENLKRQRLLQGHQVHNSIEYQQTIQLNVSVSF